MSSSTTSTTVPNMGSSIQTMDTFTEAVKSYVSMDSQCKLHQHKIKEYRDARSKLENLITDYMAKNRISTINISDGQLQLASQSVKQPVTLTSLKESLDEYFKATPIVANQVFEYIKSRRVEKHETYIKRLDTSS